MRPDGSRQVFSFPDHSDFIGSVDEIPEPHVFAAKVTIKGETHAVAFEEHEHAHGAAARDNNLRAAFIHVMGDAAVSVTVIVGLVLARAFGCPCLSRINPLLAASAVGMWATRLRCPSEAAYPQLLGQPGGSGMAAVEHQRCEFLRGGAGGGAA